MRIATPCTLSPDPALRYGYLDAEYAMFPYTLDYKSKQDCPIEPCPSCSWPGVWEQPMIDLEDEWLGSNPACPECGNVCSMLDGCVMCVLTSASKSSIRKFVITEKAPTRAFS